MDQVAHATGRPQVFADHCADESQADAGVQAGEHPARRARQVDMAQQLARRRPEHPGVGQDHRADLFDALVDVEEHDEEHQRDAQRHLAGDAQTKPDREDRRQDDARHRVHRLDVGLEQRAGHRLQRQPQPAAQTAERTDAKGQQGLDQRDAEVAVDVGVGDEPVPDPTQYFERLTEEERRLLVVLEHHRRQQARAGQQMPDRKDRQQQRDLPDPQIARFGLQSLPHGFRPPWRGVAAGSP